MHLSGLAVVSVMGVLVEAIDPAPADVYAAQAIAPTRSPTSYVRGRSFDRYVSIWFENTDYDMAFAEPNFDFFAKRGITLANNFAVTHPSEPNYMATIGGEYFGLNGDPFIDVPENVSSVIDLLEEANISWAHYQEDMPYSGYEGSAWVNRITGANDYVRKHNPAIMFKSITNSDDRRACIKNTTLFWQDLDSNTLPQWMFITPNMTSDGHDSSVTVAGQWLRTFLEPLLDHPNFMNNTLVLITFDENEHYTTPNRVFSVLLGDAVPANLLGTTDPTYYNHYSELATVEANWGLHTLGRWDVGANVFAHVATTTGDTVRVWNASHSDGVALEQMYYNASYPGIFNSQNQNAPQPVPNVNSVRNGRTTSPAIQTKWRSVADQTYYDERLEIPDAAHPPVYPKA